MSATIEGAETKPKRRPPAAGKGRPVGATNLVNRTLKEAILQSFKEIGGVQWLNKLAEKHPPVYASLLGRVLPMEITGPGGGQFVIRLAPIDASDAIASPAVPTAPQIEGNVRDAEVVPSFADANIGDGEVEATD